ncbi:hypothetical protein BGZ52_009785, partial [Haplosporangium bisporale]
MGINEGNLGNVAVRGPVVDPTINVASKQHQGLEGGKINGGQNLAEMTFQGW